MDQQPSDHVPEIARLQGLHYVYLAFKEAVPIATPDATSRGKVLGHLDQQLEAARTTLVHSQIPEAVITAFEAEVKALRERLLRP